MLHSSSLVRGVSKLSTLQNALLAAVKTYTCTDSKVVFSGVTHMHPNDG